MKLKSVKEWLLRIAGVVRCYYHRKHNKPFIGRITHGKVYNRELTQAEITDIYNKGNGKHYPTDYERNDLAKPTPPKWTEW